jgi:16S rRNA processing protein RimM
MPRAAYLECGEIINTHGVRGAVKINPWCDSPAVLASMKRVFFADGDGYRPVRVRKTAIFKQFVLAELEGITDIDQAMALKGTVLYAAREDFHLGENDHFIADLIGLPVYDARDGRKYGTLVEVTQGAASDLYTVRTPSGDRMMPAVDAYVQRVDPDEGVYVTPIPGMLEDEGEAIVAAAKETDDGTSV